MLPRISLLLFFFTFSSLAVVKAQNYLLVESIEIFGNKKTKPFVILRELSFKMGDSITEESLPLLTTKNQNMVFNTGLFNEVLLESEIDSSKIRFKITVKERWYIWPYPIIGYADRNFNIWWQSRDISRLNAGFSIKHSNFRGRNEKLILRLIAGYTRQAELDYLIPYIDGKKKFGLQFQLGAISTKELWYRADSNKLKFLYDPSRRAYRKAHFEASLHYRPELYFRHQLMFGVDEISVSDTVLQPEQNPNYLAGGRSNQFSVKATYTFKWDRRDIIYYPLKGHFIEWNFEPIYLVDAKQFHLGSRLNLEKFFKMSERFYSGISMRAKTSFGAQPYNLFQAIGYKYVLRGFENYVIDGEHFVLFKSNIKYQLFSSNMKVPGVKSNYFNRAPTALYICLYADAGYVSATNRFNFANSYRNSWLSGYGLGLDLATYYDRVIRLEYSINNFGLKQVYLHFTAPI